ncbi:cellulase family glycosylhydrolase [Tianweitania sp. BSSL-BM11]|uniref:Cellulase family glycosylhydrolase n=1 Tax=Tianweitania aestuarii TaxID=2814886 RepID=A0ABS5RZZ2_9HYPH|nr:cellulase family glycosylhydrolase [Tianweitania aestuarii]MBS9722572.1 cellulase family glycosylhydrolase [Tianweitania aestuarii]
MAPSSVWIKTCLLAAGLLLAAAIPSSAASFTIKRGINLDQWVTWPMEDRWNDETALLPFPEWKRFVVPEKLAQLKADGFDFVRMPIDPAPFLSAKATALHDRLFEEVLEAVRLLDAAGLKVIVDLHLIERDDNPANGMSGVLGSPERFDDYLAFVRQMGRTLATQDPSRVALELMNEPGTTCDEAGNADWRDRLLKLYAAARSSATKLTLVLTGGCAGNAEGLVALDAKDIPDENVIWTFHSYQPFLLTHQGALWAGDFIRYVTGLSYPLDGSTNDVRETIRKRIQEEAPVHRRAGMLYYLDEQLAELDTPEKLDAVIQRPFDQVAEWAKHNQVAPERILLGEFGMIRQEYQNPFIMPAASRAKYAKDMISAAQKHGFAWAIWGYGGAFGVVESFDGQPAEPDVLDVIRALPKQKN